MYHELTSTTPTDNAKGAHNTAQKSIKDVLLKKACKDEES